MRKTALTSRVRLVNTAQALTQLHWELRRSQGQLPHQPGQTWVRFELQFPDHDSLGWCGDGWSCPGSCSATALQPPPATSSWAHHSDT